MYHLLVLSSNSMIVECVESFDRITVEKDMGHIYRKSEFAALFVCETSCI